MIQNASKNVNQLLSQAKVVPQRNGMKIVKVKPRSLLRRLGLRSGDVIQSVNNRRIQSMDDAMNIYQDLMSGGKISVELLRRNRPQTYEYRIR